MFSHLRLELSEIKYIVVINFLRFSDTVEIIAMVSSRKCTDSQGLNFEDLVESWWSRGQSQRSPHFKSVRGRI